MKKNIAAVVLFGLMAALFSGCALSDKLNEMRSSAVEQANATVDSVKKKAAELEKQVTDTKKSIETKIDDVNNAVKQVTEASDAIKKAAGK